MLIPSTTDSELAQLGIGKRIVKALAGAGICTISQLESLTETELLLKRRVGYETSKRLRPFLREEKPPGERTAQSRIVSVVFDTTTILSIEEWAAVNGGLSRSEAIKRLVGMGLKCGSRRESVPDGLYNEDGVGA